MEFFIDTADVEQIRGLMETGMVDGITTNPTLMAKTGKPMAQVLRQICEIVSGPVSAEVVATDYATMKKEALYLTQIADNVVVKVPLTRVGLQVCRELHAEGKRTNVTLCFSVPQAILAAKAGATYISPFVGRLDDISGDGIQLLADICTVYDQYPFFETQVLCASVRHPGHVVQAALAGTHVITLPPKLLEELYLHPLTDKGLALFLEDWRKTGQTLLPS